MRLVRVGRAVWDVLMLADEFIEDVLTTISKLDKGFQHAKTMTTMLKTTVPMNGIPTSTLRFGPLGDGIFEFKAGPRNGKKLRVLWFYDDGRRIVCALAFLKGTAKTPPEEKRRAIDLRSEYFAAKNSGRLLGP